MPAHRQRVVDVRARRAERLGDQVAHGQHGRAGVEGETVLHPLTGTPAGQRFPLHHRHVVALSGQVAGGGQAGQPGADHNNLAHLSRQAIWCAILVSWATPSGCKVAVSSAASAVVT